MPFRLAMYENSLPHIEKRLRALDLDCEIATFDRAGVYRLASGAAPAEDAEIDYLWLSSHVNADGAGPEVFDIVRRTRRIDVLQTFNAGLDNPLYGELSKRGVRICNSSAQGIAIAEYVFAQVFGAMHPLDAQRAAAGERKWVQTPFRELSRTHWLIVGFGPIGEAVAERAKAFGAKTTVIRRAPETSGVVDRAGTMEDLAAFAGDADVIVLACPLTPETEGRIDAAFFANTKPDAVLVNIARGGLIEDEALLAALDDGRLGCAVLDVFQEEPLPQDDPYWAHPKVRVTGHTSFAGDGGRDRWDALFLDNIARYARGEPLLREVDPKDVP